MQIQCTKKLLERMKADYAAAREAGKLSVRDDFFCWHANIITVDRRKVLVFVNNSTRLAVIAYRPKPSAYMNPGEILEAGIRELFGALGIHDDVTEQYIKNSGPCLITTSGTKSQVARMNKTAEDVAWRSLFFREDTVLQTTASVEQADFPVSEGKGYFVPQDRLCEELCRMMNLAETEWNKVRSIRSYRLKVTLDLENYDIYRIIEAPAHARFWQLHEAIQRSFGWFDYHLHIFTFYDGEVTAHQRRMYYNKKRTMVILDHNDPEAQMHYDPEKYEIQKDRSLLLRDVFEKRESCVYSYDFGDNWEHVITVEDRIEDGSGRFKLLEMQGERPPEDVGGEGGFENYMRIISDKNDPEYEDTMRWAEITRAKQETMEVINKKLGYIM